ncbi:putative xyloglucan endotransglucosylase/hydrolase protein 16-like [Hibiscus syriacus]|uniref:Xyloglucan endotransglucosylase/hydrolase protein 16-like n=1 Tax=Hibiscus syriacus TaxID=106335 RepID=A0A6A2WVK5_HIBSY|nr:putative xyloglucan endotransglucosylase/hydrolase protein 16-like [Hibiscus syriacus]
MPRKVNYGVDYDDDDDDDYDEYDYGYEVEDNAETPPEQETVKHSVWRCAVCTYDNDETMSSCDICGVLRSPLLKNLTYDEKRAGFHSLAANIFDLKSSRVHANVVGADEAVKVSSKSLHSSNVSTAEDKHNRLDEITFLKNLEVDAPAGSRTSDNSSAPVPESCLDHVDESSVAVNMQYSGKSSPSLMPKERNIMVDNSSASRNGGKAHDLASNLKNISFYAESGHSNDTNPGRENSYAWYKPEKWMLPEKAEHSLGQLNLAIVGHVDSGKSTLSGRLLHVLGRISQKEMHKYEKESKLQGKGSFAYAWALDESAEERERGITMTDTDFVPNMITGATQADAAILVIDASIGSFEAGMDGTEGQTREHAQLIRSFGVDQLIVAVNKMDAVDYSKDRFDLIISQLGTFLCSCGFKDSCVSWIPLSAAENQNLVSAPSDFRLSWYHGPNLLDTIDSLQPPRDFLKPLHMPICDVIKSSSQGQVSACGKLEAGALRSGSKVLVMPSAIIATVRSLERDSQPCTIGRAGDNVTVSLHGVDANHVLACGVLCHPDFPVAFAKHLELKLEFHIHHAKESARIARISSLLDSKTGKVAKKAPRCIVAKQSAVVILHEAVCVEEFSKRKALGRVFLRTLGRTVAVGIVTRIVFIWILLVFECLPPASDHGNMFMGSHWRVFADETRLLLDEKKHFCEEQQCTFSGTYSEQQKHVQLEHPQARIHPAWHLDWENLQQPSEIIDSKFLKDKPWASDPHFFKRVKISALARSVGTIMRLMQGKTDGDAIIVMDAFALPVEGKASRLGAQADAYESHRTYRGRARQSGVKETRLRVCTLNVGTLNARLLELTNVLSVDNARNGVGILVSSRLKENVVEVCIYRDRIMMIKIIIEAEVVNVLSVYTPHVGLGEGEKRCFWDSLDDVLRSIPEHQRVFIGGDFNGHIGSEINGYDGVHGGFDFGSRNEEGRTLLEFATAHDMVVTNSFFNKRDVNLITFHSGGHCTQIDYILVRNRDRWAYIDCKVFPEEACAS